MNERQRLKNDSNKDYRQDVSGGAGLAAHENEHSVFNLEGIENLKPVLLNGFLASKPLAHWHLRNLIPYTLANYVHSDFPTAKELAPLCEDSAKRLEYNGFLRMPPSLQRVFTEISQSVFLNLLEESTGIEGLIPDPYLEGAGICLSLRGAEKNVKIGGKRHPKLNLKARLKLRLEFNKDWVEHWGGGLELRANEHSTTPDVSFPVQFNQAILIDVSEPTVYNEGEMTCPAGVANKSLSAYYYTSE